MCQDYVEISDTKITAPSSHGSHNSNLDGNEVFNQDLLSFSKP